MFVIIVGGGKVGAYLANILLSGGHRVSVIETDKATVERLKQELPHASVTRGNGAEPGPLEQAGVRQAHVVAAVTGADETNLVVTSLARFEFRVPRVIARVNNPKNAWLFTSEMGCDVALNQADLMAHLIAEEMSLGDMITLLKLRKGQFSLIEEKVHPTAGAIGRAVRELDLPAACVLVAVIRKGELLIPRGELTLQPADEVIALAHSESLPQLAQVLGPHS